MQINCTVFIQIINFWVTYFFLRKILLEPTIAMINKNKSAMDSLNKHLKEKEFDIDELIKGKNKALTNFREQVQFKYKKPEIKHLEIKTDLVYESNKQQVEALINSSKNLIIEKVSNALQI
jgi:hypothetical protein